MWLSVAICLLLIPPWLALCMTLLALALEAASWMETKVRGDDPGKLRKTLAGAAFAYVAALGVICIDAGAVGGLAVLIRWRFPT